jgi:hypothetical protein
MSFRQSEKQTGKEFQKNQESESPQGNFHDVDSTFVHLSILARCKEVLQRSREELSLRELR